MDPIEQLLGRTAPWRGPAWTPPEPPESERLLGLLSEEDLPGVGVDLCLGAPVSGTDQIYKRYRGIFVVQPSGNGQPEICGRVWCWPPVAGMSQRHELYVGQDIELAVKAVNEAISNAVGRGCIPDRG